MYCFLCFYAWLPFQNIVLIAHYPHQLTMTFVYHTIPGILNVILHNIINKYISQVVSVNGSSWNKIKTLGMATYGHYMSETFDGDKGQSVQFSWKAIVPKWFSSWWRHQMETNSVLLAICAGNSPVPGEFPTQRPVARSFDILFELGPNKRLSKQWWGFWFETPSRTLWRHCNDATYNITETMWCFRNFISDWMVPPCCN